MQTLDKTAQRLFFLVVEEVTRARREHGEAAKRFALYRDKECIGSEAIKRMDDYNRTKVHKEALEGLILKVFEIITEEDEG